MENENTYTTKKNLEIQKLILASINNTFNTNALFLNTNLELIDINQNACKLFEIIKSKRNFILRYSNQNCQICVDKTFKVFNSIASNNLGKDFLIIASIKSIKDFYQNKKSNISQNLKPYFIKNEKGLFLNEPNRVSILIVDSKGRIENSIFPEKSLKWYNDFLFNSFKNKYYLN